MKSTLALLALLLCACPQPKAGDDRLDSGTNTDTGTNTDSGTNTDTGTNDVGPKDMGPNDVGSVDGEVMDATEPEDDAGEDDGGPQCVPTGPEDCSNGIDDDCMNGADCLDPTCGQCVAVPQAFTAGLMVGANDVCPPGFTAQETSLFAGLDPGRGCVGNCMCTPNPTTCRGELFIYNTNAECQADSALTGGQMYAGLIDSTCTTMPVREGFPGGFRMGNWTVDQSCAATGVASPSPYSWSSQMKFCAAVLGTSGCAATEVCVPPVAPVGDACVIASGGAPCPVGFTERMDQWFTGASDTRSCGACGCGASGGSCQFAEIELGSDWSCVDSFSVSQSAPQYCSSTYSPPAQVGGFPTDPTCTPTSQQTGTVEATGQQTLCCLP
jgi:hypothetical protein